MTRSLLALVALVALLVLAGYWALSQDAPPDEVPATLPSTHDAPSSADRTRGPAELPAGLPTAGPAEASPETPTPSSLREEVTAEPTAAAPAPGTVLQVVNDATGAPAAGATLRLWTGESEVLRSVAFYLACEPDYALRKVGDDYTEARTDARGQVALPITGPWLLAYAELDGQEAGLLLQLPEQVGLAEAPAAELRLVPIETTLVRLEDRLGNPRPGAALQVATGDDEHSTSIEVDDEACHTLHHRGGLLTQLTGSLNLEAATEWAGSMDGSWFDADASEAVVDSPPEPEARAELPFPGAPAEVVLRTLPMGLVRIELFDSNAQPTRAGIPMIEFALQLDGHSWDHGLNPYDPGGAIDTWLPSGASIRASYRDMLDWGRDPFTFEGVVPGPGEPALVWAITISSSPQVTYNMVVQHDTGSPAAGLSLRTEFKGKSSSLQSSSSSTSQTGENGELELELPVMLAGMLDEEDATMGLTLTVELTKDGFTQTYKVHAPLATTYTEPVVDLGRLTLVSVAGTAKPATPEDEQ